MKKLNTRVKAKVIFGVGSFGQGMISTMLTLYFMFYLTQVQNLSGTIIGTVFLIFRCWDGFNDPIMGSIICRCNSKFGKYRPWIFIGAVSSAILFVLMFLDTPSFSVTGKYIYYLLLYFLWGMAYTMIEIPYWSLIPATTEFESDRNTMTSISQLFGSAATVAVAILAPMALGDAMNSTTYIILAVCIALLYMFSLCITAFGVKENKNAKTEVITYKEMFTAFKKNDQARALFWPVLLMSTAFNLTIGLGTYFFTYDIGDPSKFSFFMLIAGIALWIGTLTYPFITKKFGNKVVFVLSCVLGIIGYSFMFSANMLFHGNIYILSGVSVVALIAFGWLMVSRYVMATKVCDYSEEKTGKRMESVWISINSLSIKMSSAVVGLLTGVVLDLTSISGSSAGQISENSILILRVMMFIVPIALVGLTLLLYVWLFKLDNKKAVEKPKENIDLLENNVVTAKVEEHQIKIEEVLQEKEPEEHKENN